MADDELDTLLAKLAALPKRRPPLERLGLERFTLERRLGVGGFGEVYVARDKEHGTIVALKSLRAPEPDAIYRFKREFRIVADLAHPNIVRLYELFHEQGQWYLTMELVDGIRIDEYLTRAPERQRSCFAQLAAGITALHRAGCVHRDLKPSNALVESGGRVVLLDFGLAFAPSGPIHTAVAGTPPYMAPELARNPPTAASDWYALGVMLYEVLAGELPFRGDGAEMNRRKQAGAPVPPSQLRAGVDPDLEELALALLHPDPARRPAHDAIAARLGSQAPEPPRVATVAGRGRELAQLADALARARDAAVVVTIHGQPGIGKTSLVSAFARTIDHVHAGRCHEAESVPYKGIDGVVDSLGDTLRRAGDVEYLIGPGAGVLAQMFPALRRVDAFARARRDESQGRTPHEARRAASAALRELVRQLSHGAPVVLAVDDLQWADADGIDLLLDLLAPPAPPQLLLVTYRRDAIDRSPPLDRFLAELRATRVDIALEPLDASGVAELLAHSSIGVERAIEETGGHPYLLSRLVEGERTTGADLSAVLSAELDELDALSRTLLDIVAVSGAPIGLVPAFAAADIDRDPALLDELRRRRLIQRLSLGRDAPIEPYHDRVREVALDAMTPEYRRDLHGRLADALERCGLLEPETLARHHREAGDAPRALEWTRRAARNATTAFAFARAVELYQQAVALTADAGERCTVLEELADAQVQSGRRRDAGETCLVAADLARDSGERDRYASLRARAGEHFLLAGQLERGLQLLGDALVEVGVTLPASAEVAVAESFNLGGALAVRGLEPSPRSTPAPAALLRRLDLEIEVSRALTFSDLRAPLIATRAVLDALDAGEPTRLLRALACFVINNSARAPDHQLVVEAETRAHALAQELGDSISLAWAALASGFAEFQRANYVTALAAHGEAERRFLAAGPLYAREAAIARISIVMGCGNFGIDVPYALRIYPRCIEDARVRDDLFIATWAKVTNIWMCLLGGDLGAAREELRSIRSDWPRVMDSMFAVTALLCEVAIDLYAEPASAWQTVERVQPQFHALFSSMIPYPRLFYARLAANSALAAYRGGIAGVDVTRARIAALAEGIASLDHESIHCVLRSHLHDLAGDRVAAIVALDKAAALWSARHQKVQALTAVMRAGELRGDTQELTRAAAELRVLGVADPDCYATLLAGPRLS